MQTQPSANKPLHPLLWVAGVAVILFSAVGIGALMGWLPASTANPDSKTLPEPQSANTVAPTPVAPTKAKARAAPVRQRAAAQQVESPPPRASRAVARCDECGVVESVREIETKGAGSGLGAVGGGVVGGLLGHQVGGGRGQDVMTVVGAVGGAVAGNEVEKRAKATVTYAITIRFDDGTSRVINEASAPAWRAGDKVKVINGVIQSNS